MRSPAVTSEHIASLAGKAGRLVIAVVLAGLAALELADYAASRTGIGDLRAGVAAAPVIQSLEGRALT